MTQNEMQAFFQGLAILSKNRVIVSGLADPLLMDKTVSPSTETKTYTPSLDIDNAQGFSSVTVEAATLQDKTAVLGQPQQIITADKNIYGLNSVIIPDSTLEAKTVTPAKDAQTVTSNKYGLSSVTVAGDVNLVPENIIKGKTIFNVVGMGETLDALSIASLTVEEGDSWKINIVFSDGGQVTINDIKFDTDGKITEVYFQTGIEEEKYVECKYDGEYLVAVGDVEIAGMDNLKIDTMFQIQSKTATPTKESQVIVADDGYEYLDKVTIYGDINLIPENIIDGVSIFGVEGTATGNGTPKLDIMNFTSGVFDSEENNNVQVDDESIDPVEQDTYDLIVTDRKQNVRYLTLDRMTDGRIRSIIVNRTSATGIGYNDDDLDEEEESSEPIDKTLNKIGNIEIQNIKSLGLKENEFIIFQNALAIAAVAGSDGRNGDVKLEDIEIEPGETEYTYQASEGFDGLGKVTRLAAPLMKGQSVTPSTEGQTISAEEGYYGLGDVYVNGDANLVSKNIVEGVTIFNVTGTAKGKDPVLSEVDITPTAEKQSITPDAGYDGFSKVNVAAAPLEEVNDVTPTTIDKTITPSEEYYGISKVSVKGDANLVAENIKKGVTIFNVEGTAEGGAEAPTLSSLTFTKADYSATAAMSDETEKQLVPTFDEKNKISSINVNGTDMPVTYNADGILTSVGEVIIDGINLLEMFSGGDEKMMIQEDLWTGDHQLTAEYFILKDEDIVLKYDILEVRVGSYTQMFTVKQLQELPEVRTDFVVNNSNHIVASFKFAENKLQVALDSGTYQQYSHLNKIYGIKFTGTKPIDYSEEEQIIGKYLGKTLYQKTIEFSVSAKVAWIPSTITNIEKIVNQIMVVYNNSGDSISVPFYGVDGYIETQYNKNLNSFLYRTNSDTLFSGYQNGSITVQYTKKLEVK